VDAWIAKQKEPDLSRPEAPASRAGAEDETIATERRYMTDVYFRLFIQDQDGVHDTDEDLTLAYDLDGVAGA
jgi:hypothetical protein